MLKILFSCVRVIKPGVALTGRNTTGPPCSVGRPNARAPRGRPARRQCYRRRQTTTTDASEQNNTGQLGGPVIIVEILRLTLARVTEQRVMSHSTLCSFLPSKDVTP